MVLLDPTACQCMRMHPVPLFNFTIFVSTYTPTPAVIYSAVISNYVSDDAMLALWHALLGVMQD